MGTIYLVRHGQASFGSADYDQLSALGEQQSRLLGSWFRDCGISATRALSGGLRRHDQTARACLDAAGVDVSLETDARLAEYDHEEMLLRDCPDYADKARFAELLQSKGNPALSFHEIFMRAFDRWTGGQHDADYAESWPEFRDRCNAALLAIIDAAPPSSTTVVFTSGGPITAISHHLLGVDRQRLGELNSAVANASLTRILHQRDLVSLNGWNAVPHLDRALDRKLITYR